MNRTIRGSWATESALTSLLPPTAPAPATPRTSESPSRAASRLRAAERFVSRRPRTARGGRLALHRSWLRGSCPSPGPRLRPARFENLRQKRRSEPSRAALAQRDLAVIEQVRAARAAALVARASLTSGALLTDGAFFDALRNAEPFVANRALRIRVVDLHVAPREAEVGFEVGVFVVGHLDLPHEPRMRAANRFAWPRRLQRLDAGNLGVRLRHRGRRGDLELPALLRLVAAERAEPDLCRHHATLAS